ncbi:sucrase ferredoxin [Nocardiopsis lambiniae]|uniref:Sucrase ferredoxin n=1 Tax=Nocardiopsis lambiniae TaxID=3075539 RepID=A0ABU2MC13_9ACTN|nr:sucrase ferredoxin [Nocardiopsis sp. DSM 44743]MDT0330226.1 sucrase ferredoxin [Nocardiopsis sp. DSM 44743]
MRLPTAPDGSRGCSALARHTGEQIAGTAGRTIGWLLIEHPGPWRHPAFASPGLDKDVVSALAARITGHDVKPQLIKRPGPPRERRGPHRAYLAHVSRTSPWMRRIDFTDQAELLAYDVTAAEHPTPPDFGTPVDHTLYLVCTHAKKDPCCAVLGRPVAAALADTEAEVWETTHVGGDRFAANLVALPQGAYFGRLDPVSAVHTVTTLEKGGIVPDNFRGRCSDSSAVQAAEAALRAHLGTVGVDGVTHLGEEDTSDGVRVTLGHGEGLYTVSVAREEGPACPTTCSALEPSRPVHHRVVEIEGLPALSG